MQMPPGERLNEDQIALIEQWVEAGAPQKSVTTDGQLGQGGSGGSAPSAEEEKPSASEEQSSIDTATSQIICGESVEVLDHTSEEYASHPILRRDQVSICHREGFLYDRNTRTCSEARLSTSYKCNRQGLIDAFNDAPLSIRKILDQSMGKIDDANDFGEFYSIDQCGELGIGEPLATLIRLVQIDGEIQLQVRELKVEDE
jgi:hypothetical protein